MTNFIENKHPPGHGEINRENGLLLGCLLGILWFGTGVGVTVAGYYYADTLGALSGGGLYLAASFAVGRHIV